MKREHIAGMVFLVVGIAAHQIGRVRLEQRSPGAMGAARNRRSEAWARECPLWVISGHQPADQGCPLYPQQQTFVSARGMSEKCQKRTFAS